MDMSLIQSTISSLKVASDMAQGFLHLKSVAEVQGKVIELQSAILSAQSGALAANADQAAMAEEIRLLKAALAQMEAWAQEKTRYKLSAIEPGVFVYALQQEFSAGEPPHWICSRCYNTGSKHVLQNQGEFYGMSEHLCQSCNSKIKINSNTLPRF
jgi:hypothetical protein